MTLQLPALYEVRSSNGVVYTDKHGFVIGVTPEEGACPNGLLYLNSIRRFNFVEHIRTYGRGDVVDMNHPITNGRDQGRRTN